MFEPVCGCLGLSNKSGFYSNIKRHSSGYNVNIQWSIPRYRALKTQNLCDGSPLIPRTAPLGFLSFVREHTLAWRSCFLASTREPRELERNITALSLAEGIAYAQHIDLTEPIRQLLYKDIAHQMMQKGYYPVSDHRRVSQRLWKLLDVGKWKDWTPLYCRVIW